MVSIEKATDNQEQRFFNSRRTFFSLSGFAEKEKISYLMQTDFSLSSPMFDAWLAYHPFKWLTITAGQKQNFVNNTEMIYKEDRLQFAEKSLSSRTFSNTEIEFGLFLESKFGDKFEVIPKFSITLGDGRSYFGLDSRDSDLGGVKFCGRLDIYPLEYFKE